MNAQTVVQTSVLNQGQQDAADAFFQFLMDPNQKEFIISGPAGVGKTFLMGHIIDNVIPNYQETCRLMGLTPEYDEVMMTATTNQAAEVLSVACGRPTQTIHSFLNLIVKENFQTGKTELKRTGAWKVHDRKVIFIDEASMIDSDLYKMLQEGTHKCKIVYVGDHNQLAPVMDPISPVYRQNAPFYELTQQMRNRGQPALMALCQQLRETVATGVFKPVQVVPGVIDWLDRQQMGQELSAHFLGQTHDARIIAYTNKQVIEFNDDIRNNLRGLPPQYQVGEFLVAASAFMAQSAGTNRRQTLSVQTEVEILRNKGSEKIWLEDNIALDVDILEIATSYGDVYTRVPIPTDRNHYDKLLKWYSSVAGRNWPLFFQLKQEVADLRPRDASTVHKAQGSTYDTVFVDLGDISRCHNKDQAARMLYVAFSRARSRVFLYGHLAEKYGSVVI